MLDWPDFMNGIETEGIGLADIGKKLLDWPDFMNGIETRLYMRWC